MTEEERGNYSSEKEIEIQIEIQTYVNSEFIRNKQKKKNCNMCILFSLILSAELGGNKCHHKKTNLLIEYEEVYYLTV